jgi:hypothetical protein
MSTPANHVWKPSHARMATIDSFISVPRGTNAVAPPPLNWPTKDPGDVLDYILDIAPAVVGNDGDRIATLDVSIVPSNPGDLVMQSSTTDGTRIALWLSGGQAGTIYSLTFNCSFQGTTFVLRIDRLTRLTRMSGAVPGSMDCR